jgi:hypothetical protein
LNDAGQKELLYRHFRARGWYSLIEVPVYNRGGASHARYLITDVDVLALRATPELRWELIIGDCKTRKGESPANRSLWVRALMDQFGAAHGILLLRREKRPIELDHRLQAYSLGVTLLDEGDFAEYDRAMIYPAGSASFSESVAALHEIRIGVPTRFPAWRPFAEYMNMRAWNERDHFAMLRSSVGAAMAVRKEVDPSRNEHLALLLEGAGTFAVALATCIGVVFHQYLQPNERATLEEALRALIWGGRDRFEYVSNLWKRLGEAKGLPEEAREVSMPDWPAFLQLVRSHLDGPHFAFQVPQLFRVGALDLIQNVPFLSRARQPWDPMLLKLGMLTAVYYAQAGGFPPEAKARLRELFVQRMSVDARAGSADEGGPNTIGRLADASLPEADDQPVAPTNGGILPDSSQAVLPGFASASRDKT